MEIVRKHYVFRGRVQGVGFRYHAFYAAKECNVTGWVRNQYDGTVEMEGQGTKEELERVIQMLDSQQHIEIEEIEDRTIAIVEEEDRFYIANY